MKKVIFIFSLILFLLSTGKVFADQKASGSSAKIQTINIDSKSDYRVKVLSNYLRQYNSPLVPEASTFVKYADEYKLDWRLVVAISGVESTFGQQIPYNSYNGWGWGIYGTNMFYFTSWDEAIRTISQGLRQNYIDKWGAGDVYEIGRFYAASPTWASRVNYFMGNIADFELRNPQSTLSISL